MNQLQTLDKHATREEILSVIHRDGAVIIEGLMSEQLADQIEEETGNYVTATKTGDGFAGVKTTRTGALVVRSPGCRELILEDSVLGCVREFLAPFCEQIQLHLTQIIRIQPGQAKQPLHRDRQAWGEIMPPNIEPQLNTIWALTNFTHKNGATQVIPGSHTWDYSRRPDAAEACSAEMSRGSVLIYSGSVIHGGGANESTEDRQGINITYSLAWLRQEENQYLSCPPDQAKGLEPALQELLGYTMGSVACGYFTELKPAGEGREACPPEFALGRAPRATGVPSIIDHN
ncbi:MAG: phytanoyl-CoA dioxygenase family protein [Pseudomonadales bacterium]|nr:phytanoyl-CoA dioxygenase family protein [Pseudomonadales bacterium]MBO6597893.1 phytanoyl-CoA dioxygenase family protein [Pseudomonadales bacterium]MBO6657648.1 phytanoyl-CoA dioxygenase family protein [Pseudomonadales bacterium]MBO6702285.1 phytanoyl-CoA dioxygenase family protein [Pseudomonadales bacterium]MBO6824301.1 phytanoyl-CoA dioxygenase family protein [Pseudomonadales bacterium]